MQFSPDQLLSTTLHDQSGNKVGKVRQVYLNDATGEPTWVTVLTGFFGANESLVPLDDARLDGDLLQVPFDKRTIRDAPNFDPGHHLDESDEEELYRYYGVTQPEKATAGTRGPDQIGGEPVEQPRTRPDQGSRGRVHDEPGGEYVSGPPEPVEAAPEPVEAAPEPVEGPATVGDRARPDAESGGREQLGQRGQSDPGAADQRRGEPASPGSTGGGQERDLLERERKLLERERDLLDRERGLAEREGSGRPRLRRHDPHDRA